MEKEICALKDQLNKGQSNIHSKIETEEMTSQIQILCKKLSFTLDDLDAQKSYSKLLEDRIQKMQEHSTMKMEDEAKYVESLLVTGSETLKKASDDLEEQISKTKDIQIKLEKVEAENEGLTQQVEAMELEVRAVKQLQTLAEHSTKTTIQSLEVQLYDKEAAEFEARMKAEQLEADLVFEKAQVHKLQERLGKKSEALQKQKEDAKKAVERTQTYHRLQTDEHKARNLEVRNCPVKGRGSAGD
ncbi:tropomyosin-2-like isoform X1 [Sparus aurata]|uniref:tropomyosin-2-like isoform X1 n=1 Tax=Sparus aurata TaxID=8175 RepID=UPI0011C18DE7|nr:tropomyosin-2-like isoform X1 [Sparus aurata]XP_030277458.1 tropomyosin-2-like isoform X1 [Sparus aurata]